MQRQDLNWQQTRWAQYLSRFNAVWCYKPGPSMKKPNALSRWEDHAEGIEDDNKGVVVITLDKIRTTILIMDEGDSLKQKNFNATCLLSEADVQRLCKKNAICGEHDGTLTDNLGRLYVPESNLLSMEVIQKHHDSLVAGHLGYKKTLDLLQHNYYWPGMATTVKEYVTRCNTCQRFKGSNAAPAGLLHPLETPLLPWKHISANFITDLPLSHGFDTILTVVDWFSKEVELISCTKTCLALDTAKLFMHNIWKYHGLPCSITSDQGPQFAAQVMQEINKALSISTKLSTFFHPQMDGQTEIVNKEVQKFLWIYCFEKQDQWANCYGPTSGTTHSMDLVNFSLFILSYLVILDFEPWGDSLWELTYLTTFTISQTCVCLMANLVLLNLTLFLTVHFRAVHGYAATHMRFTHVLCFSSILPLPCGCIMLLISAMPALDSIGRSGTYMYIQYDSI